MSPTARSAAGVVLVGLSTLENHVGGVLGTATLKKDDEGGPPRRDGAAPLFAGCDGAACVVLAAEGDGCKRNISAFVSLGTGEYRDWCGNAQAAIGGGGGGVEWPKTSWRELVLG